ncbi:lysozyme [Modicisalibacter luteus]|uniref:Lysozyme n=1 Tax=Modicisalibacter luteus TaxID=453962 RepID=A0ABV7M1U4_9GAMM|nr:lysozyme [Halomonas lutea]GHB12561.1 lysozyme [Halomonas lutea]
MRLNKRLAAAAGGGVLALASIVVSNFEGTELQSYRDAVGTWTVCTGHTTTAQSGQVKSPQECARRCCVPTLAWALEAVDEQVTVPIAVETRAALVSFVFNVGAGALKNSTLLRKVNTGDNEGACNELPRWVYAGGERLRGLVRRRAAERELCLKGLRNADTPSAVARDDHSGRFRWFDLATG